MNDTLYILVDQFDSSGEKILHIGICPDCGRNTVLVDERCSICWESRLKPSKNDSGSSE